MANLLIIKELLVDKKMTQQELANASGLSLRGIQQILKGNTTTVDSLERIAKALDVKPSLFFNDPPDPNDQLKQIEKALMGAPIEAFALLPVFSLILERKEYNDRMHDLELMIEVRDKIFQWLIEKKHIPSFTSFQTIEEQLDFMFFVTELLNGESPSLGESNSDMSPEMIRNLIDKNVEMGESSELLSWIHSRNDAVKEQRCRKVLKIPVVQELLLHGKTPDSYLRIIWDKYYTKDDE
jgi:transcriptional regulator with XRE-family HTH domain